MKRRFTVILLCALLLVGAGFLLAPVVRNILTATYDRVDQADFLGAYAQVELCAKQIDEDFYYYTAWCASAPEDDPMLVLRVYYKKELVAGDITTEHFSEGAEIKVYRVKYPEPKNKYVVYGHNPEGKYGEYVLDLLDNNQVDKHFEVNISDQEYILDVYDGDKIYIPRLELIK